jgi:hypothetical protein
MRFRRPLIAATTLVILTLGLPALGRAVGIYQVRFHVFTHAYATVAGACGQTGHIGPEGGRRISVCFGESLDVRYGPEGGDVGRVQLWVRDVSCDAEGACTETRVLRRPPVRFTVDPLLAKATVNASTECGPVRLTLSAVSEPNLRTAPFIQQPDVAAGPDDGHLHVLVGGSASVGRDARMTGTLCGVTVPSTNFPNGRILRGLGSEGTSIVVRYN